MLNKLSLNLIKTGLGFLVCLNSIHSLVPKSQAATLRLFPETADNLANQQPTTPNFIDSDLFALLIPNQAPRTASNNPFNADLVIDAVSDPTNVSVDSIITSFRRLNLDTDNYDSTPQEVPILSQVAASDIYQDIYDFGSSAASELRDPLSIDASSSQRTPTVTGGPRSAGIGVAGIPNLNLDQNQPSSPFRGGPIAIIGSPSENFVIPLSQVSLPSANPVQAAKWGDGTVDRFFASLPQQEVVDVDTFMRTVYRTSVSDMIKQIDSSLDLTIDTQFNSMPAEIFPNNAMPSGDFNRNL
ncbi:hypothetical protein [Crocosphaera sp. Alani8]|uniref:hypothetical protein n=1 Tax=Crocosphaera sp. Alani8 TaxID=3038952 RepID=UPI00313BD4D5